MAESNGRPPALERLIATVAHVVEHARGETHPAAIDRTKAAITDELEKVEADLADFLRPFLTDIAAHPDVAPEVRDAFSTLTAPQHQSQLAIAFAGVYALVRQFVDAALQPPVQSLLNHVWPLDPSVPLSPAEAALAVLRNNPHLGNPAGEASLSGTNGERFQALVYNTGDGIPIQEALLLFRRGQIDVTRLEQAVRQSRIRDEWVPEILELRYAPPSPSEILSAAVQNQLPLDQALTKFQEAGVDPANFEWEYNTHGRPLAMGEMATLWNRGEATQADFDQALRESDIKNKYVPFAEKLREYHVPPRSIVAMLRNGAITAAYARQLLAEEGVRPQDIDLFIAEGESSTTAKARDVTQAQVLRFYGASLISRAEATTRLETLKYDAASITLLLDYEDNSRIERYMAAVISRVHSRYVAYHIDDAEAVNALIADKMPAAAAQQLLDVWKIERGINLHSLTPAQIVGAYRRGEISAAETKLRLTAVGVQQSDLAIVVADGYPPTKPDPTAVAAVVNA